MNNNNHDNSDCTFAGQLVSYLYGEASAAESASFERHLDKCPTCADELKAFSGVHFSIGDWKMQDFANLETPAIEIPYEKAKQTTSSSVKETRLSGILRDLFSLSPRAFSLATASFAVLAICVSVIFLVMNSSRQSEVVAEKESKKIAISPTAEQTPPDDDSVKPSPAERNQPSQVSKQTQPDAAVDSKSRSAPIVKTSGKPAPTTTTKIGNSAETRKDVKRSSSSKSTVANAPKMIEEDEEDETLRLAELFDEIGSVEE